VTFGVAAVAKSDLISWEVFGVGWGRERRRPHLRQPQGRTHHRYRLGTLRPGRRRALRPVGWKERLGTQTQRHRTAPVPRHLDAARPGRRTGQPAHDRHAHHTTITAIHPAINPIESGAVLEARETDALRSDHVSARRSSFRADDLVTRGRLIKAETRAHGPAVLQSLLHWCDLDWDASTAAARPRR